MGSPTRRATAIAMVLVAAPACRGCVIDDPSYAGGGGAGATSTGDATGTGVDGPTTSAGGGGGSPSSSSASSSSSGGGGSGGAGTGGAPEVCPVSDDFEDGLDPCWTSINEADATVTPVGGVVEIRPDEGTGWYDDEDGIFVYQEVTGDFAATLRVDTATVEGSYQLAGFLLRDPTAGPEDWIKSEVGRNATVDTPVYVGFTVASQTTIVFNDPEGVAAGVLGVCRRGDSILLGLNQGAGWMVYGNRAYHPDDVDVDVPDFPETIQVGFNAASTVGALVATVDDFRLQLGSDEDCRDALEALDP